MEKTVVRDQSNAVFEVTNPRESTRLMQRRMPYRKNSAGSEWFQNLDPKPALLFSWPNPRPLEVRNCCRRSELPGIGWYWHHPRNTLDRQDPTSARSMRILFLSVSFSSFRFARSFLIAVIRRMAKPPFRVVSQMCVKPRKVNVSGGPSPALSPDQ